MGEKDLKRHAHEWKICIKLEMKNGICLSLLPSKIYEKHYILLIKLEKSWFGFKPSIHLKLFSMFKLIQFV